jgi:hypothetical protein
MIDRYNRHMTAGTFCQSWQKPVHMIKIGQSQEHLTLKQLQGTTGVGIGIIQQPAADPIGQPRADAF